MTGTHGTMAGEIGGCYALKHGCIRWCGREDLNLNTWGTCTSSMRVCQFRHDREIPTTRSN